ncbi:hypothetical protein BJ928_1292 [Rhizobium sp. WW_1]|jgi:hypothetical protein|nr:hypothetical protein BJ928_1292 [Rhizobium sp. WW_1]
MHRGPATKLGLSSTTNTSWERLFSGMGRAGMALGSVDFAG